MGEYKLIIRFDTPKRLSDEDRRLLKALANEYLNALGDSQRIDSNAPMPQVQVIYSKLLNVSDSGGKGNGR